jgi:hypothetical protein
MILLQGPVQPDVVEAGRVLATLDDWRAIAFVLVLVIVILIVERAWYSSAIRGERRDMSAERERMWGVSEKFGDAAAKYSEATHKVVTELEVNRALNARLESTVGVLEKRVAELDSRK